MNARGVWWDLCLNKPYSDGGYENSTRVFNNTPSKPGPGWDDPGLRAKTKVYGCEINVPPKDGHKCRGWTAEVAFPLRAISLNNTNHLPPARNSYWRINFSRVEWKVHVEGSAYVLGGKEGDGACKWPCTVAHPGTGCPQNPGDNWLWAPLGIVDVHQPERWGYLQFADGEVNGTEVIPDPDYAIRSVAMQVYYAQKAFAASAAGRGNFTEDMAVLAELAPLGPAALNGTCTCPPTVTLAHGRKAYTAHVGDLHQNRTASVTQDRYLLVV